MDIVTVQNLKKTFGKGANKVEALRGIDLNVEKGSFTDTHHTLGDSYLFKFTASSKRICSNIRY